MNLCQKCHWNNVEFVTECSRCGAAMLPPMVPHIHSSALDEFLTEEKSDVLHAVGALRQVVENRTNAFGEAFNAQSTINLQIFSVLDRLVVRLDEEGLLDRRKFYEAVDLDVRMKRFAFTQKMLLDDRLEAVLRDPPKRGERFGELVRQAWPLIYSQRHQEAMSLLREAAGLQPGNVALLRTLAEINYIRGDVASAQTFVQKLVTAAPDLLPGHLLAVLIHLKKGEVQPAMEILQNIHQDQACAFSRHFLEGTVRFLSHSFEEAGEAFRNASRLHDSPELPSLGAMAFFLGGDIRSAENLLGDSPGDADPTGLSEFLQGMIRLRRRHFRKADACFRQAAACNPKWDKARKRLTEGEAAQTHSNQVRIFTVHLRRRMEEMMTVLFEEIQRDSA